MGARDAWAIAKRFLRIRHDSSVYPLSDWCSRRIHLRHRNHAAPATLVDAKFSLPFCVALAAARGQIHISDFSAASLHDPEVLGIARKVVPVEDSTLDWKVKIPDGCMEITTRDGRNFARVGDNVPGSPEAPMSWDELATKFRECASVAAVPVSADGMTRALELAPP